MVYSTRQMYYIALANAIKNGPRIISRNGVTVAAYSMTKNELKLLFVDNGYSPRRKAWMNNVTDWALFDAEVSKNFADVNSENGYVIFKTLSDDAQIYLRMYAEDNSVPSYPIAKDPRVTA